MSVTTEKHDGLTVITVDMGSTVLCDACCADWTERPESGGLYSYGWAICPDCAPQFDGDVDVAVALRAGIRPGVRHCPADQSFANWVRKVLR